VRKRGKKWYRAKHQSTTSFQSRINIKTKKTPGGGGDGAQCGGNGRPKRDQHQGGTQRTPSSKTIRPQNGGGKVRGRKGPRREGGTTSRAEGPLWGLATRVLVPAPMPLRGVEP